MLACAVQVALAVTVAVAAGVHLRPAGVCLLENHAGEHESCYLTYTASGLTIPICAAAVALEVRCSCLVSSLSITVQSCGALPAWVCWAKSDLRRVVSFAHCE